MVSTLHSVRIEGLKPGTAYRYRIYQQGVDDSGAIPVLGRTTASNVYSREPYRVRTFDTAADKCRFTVVNDIHGRDSILRALTADATKREVDFVAFNGDMSSLMSSMEQLPEGLSGTVGGALRYGYAHSRGARQPRDARCRIGRVHESVPDNYGQALLYVP